MSLKNYDHILWLIVFAAFFTPTHAFAITEKSSPLSVSVKPEIRSQSEEKTEDKWATASLVIGLLTPVAALMLVAITSNAIFIFWGAITALLSLIFGIKALIRIKKAPNKRKGKSVAIAGIIISCLYLALVALLFSALIATA